MINETEIGVKFIITSDQKSKDLVSTHKTNFAKTLNKEIQDKGANIFFNLTITEVSKIQKPNFSGNLFLTYRKYI